MCSHSYKPPQQQPLPPPPGPPDPGALAPIINDGSGNVMGKVADMGAVSSLTVPFHRTQTEAAVTAALPTPPVLVARSYWPQWQQQQQALQDQRAAANNGSLVVRPAGTSGTFATITRSS